MKAILTCLLFFVGGFTYSQVNDDFSDGNFNLNPVWGGMEANFEIDQDLKLHLNAPSQADTSFLSTPSQLINNTKWQFKVELDFGTSSANLARVYLVSDQADLENALNGYFVLIGSTQDEISLYRQDGLSVTKIIDGQDGFISGNSVLTTIEVERDGAGNWNLNADQLGGSNYVNQGIVNDNTYINSSHFGVFCKYTSTRSDKFYFDDISVFEIETIDTFPPQLVSVDVIGTQSIMINFNDGLDLLSAQTTNNFSLDNGMGIPNSATLINNNQSIELVFNNPFVANLNYQLSVQNVQDDSSNFMLPSTINFVYQEPVITAYHDVIITEIMADPSPVVGLPEVEYIELFNNSSVPINLENWKLTDGASTMTLVNYILYPNFYVLISEPGTSSGFGLFNIIEGSLPSLNNSGDELVLINENNLIIDSLSYDLTWYKDLEKSDGGYSLELMDLDYPCSDQTNWHASLNSSGGTPGDQNSIFDLGVDSNLPLISEYYLIGDSVLEIHFNRTLMSSNIDISPAINFDFIVYDKSIIISSTEFIDGIIYKLTLSDIQDCGQNEFEDIALSFGLPQIINQGDVLINEVLFNPSNDGTDYIEIVNVSDKLFSFSDLQIGNIDDGLISNLNYLSDKQTFFFPGDYIVLSEDSLKVIKAFNTVNVLYIEMDLPSYNNDSGTVVLSVNNNVIDKFSYTEEMHFKLLDDVNGKALERLSFDDETQSIDNWYTASQKSGWGTPGHVNSQQKIIDKNETINILTPIFSPDNDGYQDFLELQYSFENPDNLLDIVIYNSNGIQIKELKDNYYPGTTGTIIWDGITDDNVKAPIGSYIILINVFDLEGNLSTYKFVAVLATQF